MWLVALFGLLGYGFHKLGLESTPLLLGFILGPMMEEYLRRALVLSRGDWSVFVTRPLSAGLLAAAALLLVLVLLPAVKQTRQDAFTEDWPHIPAPTMHHTPFPRCTRSAPAVAQRDPCPPARGPGGADGDHPRRHVGRRRLSARPAGPTWRRCC